MVREFGSVLDVEFYVVVAQSLEGGDEVDVFSFLGELFYGCPDILVDT